MFQTDRIVIVGGPSAVGKSTLLRRMREGELSHLREQLGVVPPNSYIYLSALKIPQIRQSSIDALILHYDFFSHYSPIQGFAYLPDLISRSSDVVALTLCTSTNVLFKRITSQLTQTFVSFLCGPNLRRANRLLGLWEKRELYKHVSNLSLLYEKWSEFIQGRGITTHLILDPVSDFLIATTYERNKVEALLKT